MEFSKVLLDKISYYLRERNETISIAESVTSGLLQLAFSQMPNAQDFYNGGMTTYTLREKVKHLNVDRKKAEEVNCVSKNITETMALNVAKLFDTEWSIATTGYCTLVPESKGEIFAHYAITYKNQIILSDRIDLHPQTKPLDAQNYFVECILSCLPFDDTVVPSTNSKLTMAMSDLSTASIAADRMGKIQKPVNKK